MLTIRKAKANDFERIMEIYRFAQNFMIQSGNPDQWGHFYPTANLIKSDIAAEISYVIFDESDIHGVCALAEGQEPTYQKIENGAWLNEEPYVTIHRIAGDGQVKGVFQAAVDYCKGISDNVRIDTHENNTLMQKVIERNGFKRCGTIYVADGSARIAYHWAAQ